VGIITTHEFYARLSAIVRDPESFRSAVLEGGVQNSNNNKKNKNKKNKKKNTSGTINFIVETTFKMINK
jgi:hypothetical protein